MGKPIIQDLATKQANLISLFSGSKTMADIARKAGISRQGVQWKIRRYGVVEEWNSHKQTIPAFRDPKSKTISCIYALYFDGHSTKYYGSTKGLNSRLSAHLNNLKQGNHSCVRLQEDFDRYGYKKLRFQIIKIVDQNKLLEEEQKVYDQSIDKYNERSPTIKGSFYKEIRKICRANRAFRTARLPARKSRYKHVTWFKLAQLWRAQPFLCGKQHFAGYFKSEVGAKAAVDRFFAENPPQ